MNIPFTIDGMPVCENAWALERTDEPVRRHRRTRSTSETYHRRVQKKWIKRFGYVYRPCIWRTPEALIVHPALMAELRRAAGGNDRG